MRLLKINLNLKYIKLKGDIKQNINNGSNNGSMCLKLVTVVSLELNETNKLINTKFT